MNTNEFINNLSNNAQIIIKEHISYFKYKLSDAIEIGDVSKVIINTTENEYEIYIKYSNDIGLLERRFMHEFFHCVQYELGFPSLKTKQQKYKTFTTDICSVILDINIIRRLQDVGYSKDVDDLNTAIELLIRLYSIKNISRPFEEIIIDMLTLTVYNIFFINKRAENLINILRKNYYNTYLIYEKCKRILSKYDYNTPEGVYNIFEDLIIEFSLGEYLTIFHEFIN